MNEMRIRLMSRIVISQSLFDKLRVAEEQETKTDLFNLLDGQFDIIRSFRQKIRQICGEVFGGPRFVVAEVETGGRDGAHPSILVAALCRLRTPPGKRSA
jgi:hypothetical protein